MLQKDPPFDETEVFEHKRATNLDAYFTGIKPTELLVLEQKAMRAEEEANYFANEACKEQYQERYKKAKARYEEAKDAWRKTQIDKATAQQNELRCDYIRSNFGNNEIVKKFLFHLSSVCLTYICGYP